MTIHNLGNIEITEQQVRSSLIRMAMMAQVQPRGDASGAPAFPSGMIDRARQRWDALALEAARDLIGQNWRPDDELRADALRAYEIGRIDAALSPGPAGFLRDFDYVHREILAEERPRLNAGRLFPMDTSVPLGAPTHTWKRSVVTGKAKWHSKGEAFPLSKAGYLEELFRTGFIVCAIEQNFFEGLQIGFAGMQTYRIEAEGAIRAIEEFLNEVAFYGSPARQIYGVLTYPHLAKRVISTTFGSPSTGVQVAAAFNSLLNTPTVNSSGTFMPNRCVTSEAVKAYISTTPLDASGGTVTIEEFILKGQSESTGIREIEVAHELSADEMTAHNVGNPAGYDGILAFRGEDRRSVAHVLPQEPTFLPIWNSSPIDTLHVAFASSGGMVMHNVGNNILGFVRVPVAA